MPTTQLIDLDEAKRNRERIEKLQQSESKEPNPPPLTIQPEVESLPKRKHKPGRQRTGEYRNCIDCGCEIYVKPSRLQKRKNGQRCKPCANKCFTIEANKPRGHYTKVNNLISQIVLLYHQGLDFRDIAEQLHLARNTVKKIIHEQPPDVLNLSASEPQRKRRQQEKYKTFIFALRGLVNSGKTHNYTLETLFDKAGTLLTKYILQSPEETVYALVGTCTFTVDDLFKRTYEIVLAQYLRLDPNYEEVGENIFRIKERMEKICIV